jgi:hypothetical protein
MSEMLWHKGGCHCGTVRFEVQAPREIEVGDCNCSMCYRTGYQHLMVQKERFRLVSGEDALTAYQFNTKTAKHLFCRHCGIKSFYVPRSHPDGYSVNVRCLDAGSFEIRAVRKIDGRNWEQHYPEGRGQY